MLRLVRYVLVVIVAALLGQYGVAQERARVYRIGFLGSTESLEQFSKALSSLGYTIGQNVVIDSRWPRNERLDQLPALAEELVKLKVDVIVAGGGTAARAAKGITAEIPIVFTIIIDPVAEGLVTNVGRPGGNLTGVTVFDQDQAREQMALLKQAIPDLRRIAVLGDSGAALDPFQINEEAAHAQGLQSIILKVDRGAANPDFDGAFDNAKKAGAQAVVVLSTPVTSPNRRRIAESAIRYRIPTLSPRAHADAGGLISYGTAFSRGPERAATYVDKILKGAKPGELPVETVRMHEIVINLKAARELGLSLPPAVLSRATQVIDQ
ncbi:MAG TPA: ABC transporter substrate-binding protein [Burkholderiales bacterium]|nr:ABC transporter substrate-binding protein [Burkholderiales bacterium]